MSAPVFGLTGQTGAGKTTVALILQQAGLDVIDCDRLARAVVLPGTPCLAALTAHFGAQILQQDGTLNRKKLAELAFCSTQERRALEAVMYPAIGALLQERITALQQGHTKGIVLDAPTLFQSGADALCTAGVVALLAPLSLRHARILQRDALTEAQASARLAAQQPDCFYTKRSRFVLCNDGTYEELTAKAQALARAMLAPAPHRAEKP